MAQGHRVALALNRYVEQFASARLASGTDESFQRDCGGIWPVHCVHKTLGAEFYPLLRLGASALVVSKGTAPDVDGYSGFGAFDAQGAALAALSRERGVGQIFVVGLATDYCVNPTVLDGVQHGFAVVLLMDAILGVDLARGNSGAGGNAARRGAGHRRF